MIIQLNERALYSLGFDRAGVEALTHLVRQIGAIVGAQTLPETVAQVAYTGMDDPTAEVVGLRREVESLRITVESNAQASELSKRIDQLQQQMDGFHSAAVGMEEVRKFIHRQAVEEAFPAPLTDWEHPGAIGAGLAYTGSFTTLRASGQITSTVAAGTPPFVVASDFVVANLNVSKLLGLTWVSPGAIGSTTRNSGAFTSLSCTTGGAFAAAGTSAVISLSRTGSDVGTGHVGSDATYALRAFNSAFGDVLLIEQAATPLNVTASGISTLGSAAISGNLVAGAGFGCNGMGPQGAYALAPGATDLPTVISLANSLRAMATANGMGS